MTCRISLPTILFFTLALPCIAAEPSDFQFHKDVERAAAAEEMLGIDLDADIYNATRAGYPDLRVFDGQNAEVPFLLQEVAEEQIKTVRHDCPGRVVSLKENDDNSIAVVVELEKDVPAADGLTFVTPLIDHEQRVTVHGSRDGDEWEELAADGLIFDYTRYMDLSNREVRLKTNNCRKYRIVVTRATDRQKLPLELLERTTRDGREQQRKETTAVRKRSFRIDRIQCWRETSKKIARRPKKTDYPIVDFKTTEDADKKQTIIEVQTNREPLTSLAIASGGRNFSRRAVVQAPQEQGVRTRWVEIGKATVSRVEFAGFKREQLKITFPEQRERKKIFRIVIDNEDNPPLDITGVQARGNIQRIVFLAGPDQTASVYYGSAVAERPHYEAATVLSPLLAKTEPIAATLGPQETNPLRKRR